MLGPPWPENPIGQNDTAYLVDTCVNSANRAPRKCCRSLTSIRGVGSVIVGEDSILPAGSCRSGYSNFISCRSPGSMRRGSEQGLLGKVSTQCVFEWLVSVQTLVVEDRKYTGKGQLGYPTCYVRLVAQIFKFFYCDTDRPFLHSQGNG